MYRPHPGTTIAIKNGEKQSETHVKFNNFADGDTHCLIEDTSNIQGASVLVHHYLYPNQNEQIVRLLFLLGTLADMGARHIEVFVPYLPYARQDKAHLPGEIISSRLLCRLLHVSGANVLHTIDCHFMKGAAKAEVEGLTIHNTLVQDMLIAHLETFTSEPYHIIGPDAGSAYLAHGETMKKARADTYDQHSDGSLRRDVATLDDAHLSLTDKTVVLADDMISTGSTMIKALEALKARGVPNRYAMTTHGLFLQDSFDKIRSLTTGMFYSDTIPLEGSVPVVDAVYAKIARDLA